MIGRGRAERGAVTVEFAVALPLVAALVAGSLAAVVMVDAHGRLVAAAGAAARAHGRGDAVEADRAVAGVVGGAHATTTRSPGLVCVTVSRALATGPLPALGASATVCAADGGR